MATKERNLRNAIFTYNISYLALSRNLRKSEFYERLYVRPEEILSNREMYKGLKL